MPTGREPGKDRRLDRRQPVASRLLEVAFRESPGLMMLTRFADRVILDISENLARLGGWRREDAIGRTPSELGFWIDPGDWDRVHARLAEQAGPVEQEVGVRSDRGEVHDLVAACNQIEFEGQAYVLATAIDLSARKRAERSLTEAKEQLEATLNALPDLLFIVANDGRITGYRATRAAKLLVPPEEFLGRSYVDVLPPDVADVVAGALDEARQHGQHFGATYALDLPDGRRWFELSVSTQKALAAEDVRFVVLVREITDRKLAEAAMQESERRFRALIEHASDAIALIDGDGTVYYGSPATVRVLGYEIGDLVGRRVFERVHPDDVDHLRQRLTECTRNPNEPLSVQCRVQHRNGSWRLLQGRLTNMLGDASVGAIVVNYRDLTEEKQLEEQFHQVQKLESIGRLAGGVAHYFNNLLTAILGYAEILEAEAPTGKLDVGAVREIRRAGERARDLTRQLLTFARKQMIAPRLLDVNVLVGEAERLLRRLLGEDIAITTGLRDQLWPIEADAVQLEQVIVNLAVNARDAMPGGGTLRIETDNVVLRPEHAARYPEVAPGPHVLLAVSDSGEGMSEETLTKIFEPFFTTKPTGQGTGLGLATVYGIVRQVGGHVRVESTPGRGTTFKVYFPRATGQPEAMLPQAPEASCRGSETVLVVEDDPSVRELTARALERGGYRVLAAAHGAEALELARRLDAGIDLLVTDVVMPGQSGPEVAEAMSARYPGLKVLYVSGYTEDAIGHHGVLDGGMEFLSKPFTPSGLLAKVRCVLD